jgi:hypothetical protein
MVFAFKRQSLLHLIPTCKHWPQICDLVYKSLMYKKLLQTLVKFLKEKGVLGFLILFWIQGNPTSQKTYFMGPGKRIKPRLSQALTRSARPDSKSRPAVQISSPLPSRYASWGQKIKLSLIRKRTL